MKRTSQPARDTDLDNEPEYENVEAFVDHCLERDDVTFNGFDVNRIHKHTGIPVREISASLLSFGLKHQGAHKERDFRGFSANPHNRWIQNPTFGGSGAWSIFGLAID